MEQSTKKLDTWRNPGKHLDHQTILQGNPKGKTEGLGLCGLEEDKDEDESEGLGKLGKASLFLCTIQL
jgi:hypothetical protein